MPILEQIKSGDVSLVFRRWKKPTVKSGGTLRTRIGLLNILSVQIIGPEKITERDAKLAGCSSKQELFDELAKREGELYRISVAYGGEDPRVALRNQSRLPEDEWSKLQTRLERMDARSSTGPWTVNVLKSIKLHPQLLAKSLAEKMGVEKSWLKPNVRKLKNLGLTISHGIGYSLSPRGEAFLERLQKSPRKKK